MTGPGDDARDGWREVVFDGRAHWIKSFGGGDLINRALDRGHFYEPDLLVKIRELGRRGVYVDVGAHIGNHSLFFLAECKCDALIAIEPGPPADRLEETLRRWGHAKPWGILRVAASNKRGPVGYVERKGNTGAGRIDLKGEGIVRRPLDELLLWADVGFIKIDVEGHDRQALAGMEKTIRRCRPALSIEAKRPDERAWLAKWLGAREMRHIGTYGASSNQLWVPK